MGTKPGGRATRQGPDTAVGRSGTPRPGAYLLVMDLTDGRPARAIELVDGDQIVGRAEPGSPAEIQLADERVSGRHLRVRRGAAGWVVTDLNSTNRTYVMGSPAPPDLDVLMSDGDVLRLGDTLLVFRHGAPPPLEDGHPLLPGWSPGIREARARLQREANGSGAVLVLGETGVGKEYAAQLLHELGRPEGPRVNVNCGQLLKEIAQLELYGSEPGAFSGAESKEGLVEAAQGGTLFLDEIGDLAQKVQVELLRFLDEGTYRRVGSSDERRSDARVVAATNVDVDAAVEAGVFRRDLLTRLTKTGPVVRLAPLRQRREDLLFLAFLMRAANADRPARRAPSAGAAECLMIYDWPGNLRQLAPATRDLSDPEADFTMGADELPTELQQFRTRARKNSLPLAPRSEVLTVERAREALDAAGGNVSKAAASMGVERTKFHRFMKAHGIERDATKNEDSGSE